MTLYSRAHRADCELCLAGHDVSRLDVTVVHGVLERSAPIGVLVAHVTIEGDFGSSSGKNMTSLQSGQHTRIQNVFYCWHGDGELLKMEMKNSTLKQKSKDLHLTQGYIQISWAIRSIISNQTGVF